MKIANLNRKESNSFSGLTLKPAAKEKANFDGLYVVNEINSLSPYCTSSQIVR